MACEAGRANKYNFIYLFNLNDMQNNGISSIRIHQLMPTQEHHGHFAKTSEILLFFIIILIT